MHGLSTPGFPNLTGDRTQGTIAVLSNSEVKGLHFLAQKTLEPLCMYCRVFTFIQQALNIVFYCLMNYALTLYVWVYQQPLTPTGDV